MTVVSLEERIPKRLSLASDADEELRWATSRRPTGRSSRIASGVRSCESPGDDISGCLTRPRPSTDRTRRRRSAGPVRRRGSRDPSVGPWLGGPENPSNGPGASGGPKCSYCDMGYNRKMTRFRPLPNLRISAPPSRHLPAHPSRRRNRDYAMNFQWIFTILLFALVAPGAFTSISPPRCAGVRWLHVLVILV